jgi:two-component system heavy metal sensor histidine kinase CusS
MSSRPAEPRSIASQLVWRFALAAALLLLCSLAVLYWIVVRHAFEEDNEVLADKVFALRADLERAGGPEALRAELAILRRGERVAYSVRLLDDTGRTVVETPGMANTLAPTLFPAPGLTSAPLPEPADVHTHGRLFSLVSAEQEAGGRRYLLQVAQDRSADESFRKTFAMLLGAVLAIGTAAAAGVAVTVTRRGLRPLAEMTRAVRRVGPQHLYERLGDAGWPSELQPLARGFDEMLDRLEDSFTRLSQFSADLAHELRTPVANIRGEAEVALTRTRSAEEYRAVIESNVAECERLSQMIDSLLFLARAEAPEREVEKKCFEGRVAIENIASYYEAMAEERGVKIAYEGAAEVCADPILFGRAVSNLVANALRFTPEGGSVRITLLSAADATEVAVSNTGAGIPREHLPRIFDRFYRVDPSRSSEGTGLGLALVKSIAVLHGGTATASSEPGRGTTVTLRFPSLGRATRDQA